MPTFKVEFRFHKIVTFTVEAENANEVHAVLDERGDDIDPDGYYKANTFEDWNQCDPMSVDPVLTNPEADYVIGKTRFGLDFVVKQKSERLKGIE